MEPICNLFFFFFTQIVVWLQTVVIDSKCILYVTILLPIVNVYRMQWMQYDTFKVKHGVKITSISVASYSQMHSMLHPSKHYFNLSDINEDLWRLLNRGVNFWLTYIMRMCSSSVEHFIQSLYQVDALEVAPFPSEVCLFHQTLIYGIGWMLFS